VKGRKQSGKQRHRRESIETYVKEIVCEVSEWSMTGTSDELL
jgi:hypothetical protein